MYAITIQQPYAYYITLPVEDPRHKRVENRTWAPHPAAIGRRLAIHAGKGRDWLRRPVPFPHPSIRDLAFGAVVATCRLAACVHIDDLRFSDYSDWAVRHPHTHGPFCWILENVRVLPEPCPAGGSQGLWRWQPPAGLDEETL